MSPLDWNNIPLWLFLAMIPKMSSEMVHTVMTSEKINEFLETDEKFDVCILELFANEALLVSA
jgi:hypothetical protein